MQSNESFEIFSKNYFFSQKYFLFYVTRSNKITHDMFLFACIIENNICICTTADIIL